MSTDSVCRAWLRGHPVKAPGQRTLRCFSFLLKTAPSLGLCCPALLSGTPALSVGPAGAQGIGFDFRLLDATHVLHMTPAAPWRSAGCGRNLLFSLGTVSWFIPADGSLHPRSGNSPASFGGQPYSQASSTAAPPG